MVFKRLILIGTLIIILATLVSAVTSAVDIINSPPTLTVTSMNLNPGTSRDIYSFISDPNGDTVTCSYCVEGNCYDTCRIYAPRTPGIHRINITLNDSINTSIQTLTVFVPGEVPTKPSSSSSSDASVALPEDNPESMSGDNTIPGENQETIANQSTKPRNETPTEEDEKGTTPYCIPEVVKEKALTGKDIIFTIIILAMLAIILWLLEKDHQKIRKERHQKITELGEIFTEEQDE